MTETTLVAFKKSGVLTGVDDGSNPLPITATIIGSETVKGTTASGVTLTDAPVTIGGRAASANPTAVSNGQVVNGMFSTRGHFITANCPRGFKGTQKTTLSNTTSETTIVTAGASGVFKDLYGLILANSGATTTKVDLRDATSGSIIATFEVPTLETRGFMVPVDGAISQTTAANNWTLQCTSATTALEVTALFLSVT